MKQFAHITVIGQDKTGVVARVTSFLFQEKANIEALEEQVTRGQFSMTIQASWEPRQWNEKALREGLQQLAAQLGMDIRLRLSSPSRKQRMALLATREPKCLETVLKASTRKSFKAIPTLVISNQPDLAPIARRHGLPFHFISWEHRDRAEEKCLALMDEAEVDFVVLARFMKILSPIFVWRYKNKIINIHPSLLPSFPGPQAYRQAYEHGVKILGVTAHFVSMHLDEGPIIAQSSFTVPPRATLKQIVQRGQDLEARTLLRAVNLYLSKRLDVYWGMVKEV